MRIGAIIWLASMFALMFGAALLIDFLERKSERMCCVAVGVKHKWRIIDRAKNLYACVHCNKQSHLVGRNFKVHK